MTKSEDQGSSDLQLTLDQLHANAVHCRALAGTASDPEVKHALIQLAKDIDAAIEAIEHNALEPDVGEWSQLTGGESRPD